MLTEAARQAWIVAGGKVPTTKSLNQAGWRTGQQHLVAVNVSQFRVGEGPLWTPPEPVTFGPNVVGQLAFSRGDKGLRMLLSVSGPATEKIMVFGQAPCSAGRMKRRTISYPGLLPPPTDGVTDITDLYVARYGEPKPGEKVFIVTRQQKNGWEGPLKETSGTVPREAPEDQELNELNGLNGSNALSEAGGNAASVAKPVEAPQRGSAEASLSLTPYMHTGGTGDAQGIAPPTARCSPAGAERGTQDGKAAKSASSASGGANRASDSPG